MDEVEAGEGILGENAEALPTVRANKAAWNFILRKELESEI